MGRMTEGFMQVWEQAAWRWDLPQARTFPHSHGGGEPTGQGEVEVAAMAFQEPALMY